MATEIVHWCDVHLARDERVPVVAVHRITLDATPLVLELCEVCEVETFKPLAGFLAEHGVPERVAGKPVKASKMASASKASAPAARVTANADGRTLIDVPKVGHASGGHPNTDTTLYPCLVCEGVVEGRSPYDRHLRDEHRTTHAALYGFECPVCELVAASIVGLSSHAREHGVAGAFALFDLARQQGDPRGVVAARLAAVAGA